jgi:hypothetical protein
MADCCAKNGKAVLGPTRRLFAAAALLVSLAAGLAMGPREAEAQNACSSGCRAAYGACYKSTHDRSRCQAQLQRCLEGCIRSRESTHRRLGLSARPGTIFRFGQGDRLGHVQPHVGRVFLGKVFR